MVSLVILDGFGIGEDVAGNAIFQAGTPNLDKLKNLYPYAELEASGEAVGLTDGVMGNSEVGHTTIGAGRREMQSLEKINNAIQTGEFFENKFLNRACEFTLETGGALHLIGMLTDVGVHSHIEHLKALIDLAERKGVKKVYIHAFTDGRDTAIDKGRDLTKDIKEFCNGKNVEFATIAGRAYGMDRENRWTEKTMPAYDAIVLGQAESFVPSGCEDLVFEQSYGENCFDEFIVPTIIGAPKKISNGDAVIFFNFRADRMRQLVKAICEPDFNIFPRANLTLNYFVSMTEYDESFKKVKVAFPNEPLKNTLSEVISKNGFKQFHIAETTKYAHVTFFFNGGREEPFKNEDRKLIPSHEDPDYSHNPQMKAFEVTTEAMQAIASKNYDFVLVNLSNPDMVGHTANMEATKQAITTVDKCAYAIAMATLLSGGDCIITADHGNAEKLLNDDGSPCTTHTTSKVPFILVSEKSLKIKNDGELSNIAPTILELLNLDKPEEMTANSLIE